MLHEKKVSTVMFNNSININKTNNHLSSQISNIKKKMTYGFENSGTDLGQAHKCGRIKLVIGIPTLPFLIYRIGYWDSNPLLLDILNWLLGFQPSTS
jgi:hypothetical protein